MIRCDWVSEIENQCENHYLSSVSAALAPRSNARIRERNTVCVFKPFPPLAPPIFSPPREGATIGQVALVKSSGQNNFHAIKAIGFHRIKTNR